jgi:hypothetical protein
MTPAFAAAREWQEFLLNRGWRLCLIGGLALLRWGEPRFTRDVAVTLLAGFSREDGFIQTPLGAFRSRISDAGEFAQRNRVLLLEASNGVPLDIALGGLPLEAQAVEMSTEFEFEPGCLPRTCSAEDLIVQKMFAFRSRDVLAVEVLAVRMRGQLDWDYTEAGKQKQGGIVFGPLRILIVPALACSTLAVATPKECDDLLASCVKANHCGKKPDSRECKACNAAYESCASGSREPRGAAKKTTKR